MVRMVVFDVGETLVDETRHWSEWADWLEVPRFTFLAVLGGIIASGRHHRDVFRLFSNVDHQRAIAERTKSGWRYEIRADDFYPDVRPCLEILRTDGLRVGVVGNQPSECEDSLRRMDFEVDLLGSSESWGVEKPTAGFFERLIKEASLPPSEICYVGDHPENDIQPAHSVGLKTAFIRRGPWAFVFSDSTAAGCADLRIDTLSALPEALKCLNGKV
jgi:HAD superfamily hydrolase (TIGR01549 family)